MMCFLPHIDSAVWGELLHTYPLIHDDLADSDRLRRDDPPSGSNTDRITR